jgi:hypothetical protein
MSTYIPAANIIAANLKAPNQPREITQNGEKYTRTYLMYDYGVNGKPHIQEPLFELKVCKAKVKLNSKKKYKLNATVSDEADIAGLNQLGLGFVYAVDTHKLKFGLRDFSLQNNYGLRGAYFYPSNESGELIAGASPIVSLKMNEKTKFTLLKPKMDLETDQPIYDELGPVYDLEPIDYKTLLDKQFDCSIVISARDLYRSSGVPSPQIFVRSCMIVSKPTESGEVEHSKSEMVRSFLQQNPDLINMMAEYNKNKDTSGAVSLLTPKDPPKFTIETTQTQQQPATINNSPQVNNSFTGLPLPSPMQLPGVSALPQGNSMDLTSYLAGPQQNVGVTMMRL